MNTAHAGEATSLDIHSISELLDKQTLPKRILSLDCFDTLLWRTVSEPVEVFKDLQNHPLFIQHGITAKTRQLGERKIRLIQKGLYGHDEITIEEIYAQILPSASEALIHELVHTEIEFEKKYLFAYLPMFELLAKAKKKGMTTVLVSDMYIHAHQLEDLVACCASKIGVPVKIDHFFTSADHRTTKGRDLFHRVAKNLGVSTDAVLHVGDNPHADLQGARQAGVKGFHFNRFSPLLEDCMRKNATMQKMLSNDHGETTPITSHWHATWSLLPRTNNTLEKIGWYYLGPVMLKYCHWLHEQVQELIVQGHRPRIVFMMRDGYLPWNVYKTIKSQGLLQGDVPLDAMDVSRFATLAVNFNKTEDIVTYLMTEIGNLNRAELVRQLLGTHETSQAPIQIDTNDQRPWSDFLAEVLKEDNQKYILKVSRERKANFIRYLKKTINPQPGETLVLADLGYAGTIQDQIQKTLLSEFDLKLEGRYLILRAGATSQLNKKGLIDYRFFNVNSLNLLLTQIQSLEQLTVNDKGSLLAYGDNGHPDHEISPLSDKQRELKNLIQKAALDFVSMNAKRSFAFMKNHPMSEQETAALIGQFTLNPSASEIELYKLFSHDINNGTSRIRWISNLPLSTQMLIRGGGITYDSEYHKMLANDLNVFGPELTHFNFLKTRLGVRFELTDHVVIDGDIQGVLSHGDQYDQINMPCFHTHDGFKLGLVKGVRNKGSLGLIFGAKHEWIQIHSISLANVNDFARNPGWRSLVDLLPKTRLEGGRNLEKGLIHFTDSEGFLLVNLDDCAVADQAESVVIVVFREIAAR